MARDSISGAKRAPGGHLDPEMNETLLLWENGAQKRPLFSLRKSGLTSTPPRAHRGDSQGPRPRVAEGLVHSNSLVRPLGGRVVRTLGPAWYSYATSDTLTAFPADAVRRMEERDRQFAATFGATWQRKSGRRRERTTARATAGGLEAVSSAVPGSEGC
jgi:hypothetical protein